MNEVTATGDKRREYALIERLAANHPKFCLYAYQRALNNAMLFVHVDRRDSPEFYEAHMQTYLADDPDALAAWHASAAPATGSQLKATPAARAMICALLATLPTTQPELSDHLNNLDRILLSHQKGLKT